MENLDLSPKNNIEQMREKFSEEVKLILEKYQDQIVAFNLLTCSKNAKGFWDTNEGVKPVSYDSRFHSSFEFSGLPVGQDYVISGVNGYILDKDVNKVTFVGSLGRTYDTRPGNVFVVTLKFLKDSKDFREVIVPIIKLFETIKMHYSQDSDAATNDLKEIAREAIPVLKAFEPMARKFPPTGRINLSDLIQECEDILRN